MEVSPPGSLAPYITVIVFLAALILAVYPSIVYSPLVLFLEALAIFKELGDIAGPRCVVCLSPRSLGSAGKEVVEAFEGTRQRNTPSQAAATSHCTQRVR